MSTSEATAPQQSPGVKKLRFDDTVTTAAANSASDCWSSTRSALKTSPTTGSPLFFASSLRRASELQSSHSDAHVQLNPHAEVIEHDGSVTTINAAVGPTSTPAAVLQTAAGEVANILADVGAGLADATGIMHSSSATSFAMTARTSLDATSASANSSALSGVVGVAPAATAASSSANASASFAPPESGERFRSLLLQLASLVLEHRPKDPEQCIVDHLNARLLSTTNTTRAPQSGTQKSAPEDDAVAAGDAAALDPDTAAAAGTQAAQLRDEDGSLTAVFTPHGGTVVERLASHALPTEVGRAVLTRLAAVLISTQPDDPEDFLWARLEARNFGEEATHTVAFSADGYPVVRPEDPTQVALLKDIPTSSPGYVVAANLLPALFAKKPTDAISYLFYHIGSRARSSAAQSAHSSTRHLRYGDEEEDLFEVDSCTSREFGDDSDSAAEEVVEAASAGGSTSVVPLQRKGSLGSLFDSTAAASAQLARRRSERGDNPRARTLQNAVMSRSSSLRRSVTTGAARASREPAALPPLPDELSAFGAANASAKRVSIAQHDGKPRSPVHASCDSNIGAAGGASSNRLNRVPSLGASPTALHRAECEEHACVREEFAMLRLREELRLERLQHEVRTLTRECEYRSQMVLLNRTDRMAERAAAAAREALEEAHKYRAFLCAQIDQLEVEEQRQLRTISQQLGQPPSSSSPLAAAAANTAPRVTSPVSAYWFHTDGPLRYAEAAVPSELDILKKQVELLTMEQARARSLGYGATRATYTV